MANMTLITGGARSGKSQFAELMAKQYDSVTYVATAQIYDAEMKLRVEKHKAQRPAHWKLVEEPYHLSQVLDQHQHEADVMLIDCVTLWLNNLIFSMSPDTDWFNSETLNKADQEILEKRIMDQVMETIRTARNISSKLIFVSNEVGLGIVPDNPLSRFYRDLAGRVNQLIGQAADEVYMVMAGYPVEIKKQGQKILAELKSHEVKR